MSSKTGCRQGWIWVWPTGVCSCAQLAIQKRSQAAGQTQALRTCPLDEWHGLVGRFNSQINAKSTTASCSTSAKQAYTSNKVLGVLLGLQCACNHGLLAIQAVGLHRICGSILSTHRTSLSTKGNEAVQRNSIQLHSSAVPGAEEDEDVLWSINTCLAGQILLWGAEVKQQ